MKMATLFLLLFLISQPLFAQKESQKTDIFAIPKTYAVQNRKYTLANQISAFLGYMPMDSFTKGVVIGGAYTWYFSDFTGWEVFNANYVYDIDTGLKDDLLNNFEADPGEIPDFPNWYVTTNLIYTPIYSKNLFFNKDIIWGDLSFVAGGGVANYEREKNKPLVDFGFMLRFFVSEKSSVRLDVREYIPFGSNLDDFLKFGLAYTYQLGGEKKSKKNELDKEFD